MIKKPAFKILLPLAWMLGTTCLTFTTLIFLLMGPVSTTKHSVSNKYAIFSSKPLVLGASTFNLDITDARAAMLDDVFEKFKCPVTGLGNVFVREADKNNIPYWLVAAVSFQESNCGKKTPEKDGIESYNAWGWGVYGDNVKMFDSWEHGIQVVSKYMAEEFHSQGVTDPCEMMKTYTPPSSGSWCEGVKFFGDIISNYKSPDSL